MDMVKWTPLNAGYGDDGDDDGVDDDDE